MTTQTSQIYTPAEYLVREEAAAYKSEYRDGEIVSMAGASRKHNLVAGNIFATLYAALAGNPCEVYMNDMRLQVEDGRRYTYPDVMVACGEIKWVEGETDTLLNPTVIIEVQSSSTREHDRTTKFSWYQSLPSLKAYLLVEQERMHVVCLKRDEQSQRWFIEVFFKPDDPITLEALGCQISLRQIYAKVEFASDP